MTRWTEAGRNVDGTAYDARFASTDGSPAAGTRGAVDGCGRESPWIA